MDNGDLDDLTAALEAAVEFFDRTGAQAWIRDSPESKWHKIKLPHKEDYT